MAPEPAPKSKRGWYVIPLVACTGTFVAFILLVLVVAVLAGGTKTNTGSPSVTPTQPGAAPTTAAPAGPGTSLADPVPVGTEISPAKDWYVKVLGSERNANQTLLAANMFNRPTPGNQYVLVKVSIRNGTSKPDPFETDLKLHLIGSSGVAVSQTLCTGVADAMRSFASLQPGATLTGNMCFQVPTAEADTAALLAEPTVTVDTNEDQRFMALG
jgi:hypothetical protein